MILITGAAALALVAAGTAVGAAVASDPIGTVGVIHGCYKTRAAPNGSHAFGCKMPAPTAPTAERLLAGISKGQRGHRDAVASSQWSSTSSTAHLR